ncbi:ABC transporter substrate-binding protein [Senegalia massiliensis]|uniref:Peptide ABC transporter substrate-binding protein n=1 Tax=Senegalia massiliensis TaxID=1720316 RepID=A0A845QUP2_9CLOT|nr:peptide ABC transporter substrate-binding protein [Senegalia massiliensis]NBI05744.1 peptide ABC transporter substrate-binding protein [Senegalia massiliensis]
MKKQKIKILSIIMLISFILTACTSTGGNNGEDEKQYEKASGGEIRIPISNVENMNPLLSENESLYSFYDLIYEGLFRFNNEHDIENLLAKNYSIKNEGRTINIELRSDVKWHDGESFTSEDVKFTLDMLRHAFKNKEYRDILSKYDKLIKPEDIEHIYNVNVIDEKNIEIDFDRSFSNSIETLSFPIFPSHQLSDEEENFSYDKFLESAEDFMAIGTGPYKISEYNKGESIVLEHNESWWNEEKPYIKNIKGIILKEDEFKKAFEDKKIDVLKTTFKSFDDFKNNNDVKIHEYPSNDFDLLGFNFKNDIFKGKEGKAIRKSIAYAIDREEIIEKVYNGNSTKARLPLLNNSYLINEENNNYEYNVKKAKKILKDAGFKKTGDKKLKFKLITNSNDKYRKETADMIVEYLEEIGMEIEKIYQEDIEKMMSEIEKGDFDISLLGLELSESPNLAFAFHSEKIKDGTNFISYKNKDMDKLLVEAFSAKDRKIKKEKYFEMQKILLEDLPYVGLFFTNNALIMDERIKGDIDPLEYGMYNNIQKWFIPKELQENKTEENTGGEKQD